MSPSPNTAKIGVLSATALVISNMIGTGIFTSLGFQLVSIQHCFSVLLLWLIGAVMAFCGALVYSELGAAMPRSGGEYVYLSKTYHPMLGFLSGFVSMSIGFAAPAALSSIAFGTYLSRLFNLTSPTVSGIILLCLLTMLHCLAIRMSTSVQITITALNIGLIIFFIAAGLTLPAGTPSGFCLPAQGIISDILNPSFAVCLVYVTYAYSGWNAASYIAGDIEMPQKKLPAALCIGTVLVAVLYILLNYTFLVAAPRDALSGQLEVAYIAAQHIFGDAGGKIIGYIIALLLLASVSSFVFVGPRLTKIMGEDIPLLGFFARTTRAGIPVPAIILQFCISMLMIITTTFEQALTYVGFTLNLCSLLTVAGVYLHRHRYPDAPRPFKIWGYPLTPFLFICFMFWNLLYLLMERPIQSLAGLLTLLIAMLCYGITIRRSVKEKN